MKNIFPLSPNDRATVYYHGSLYTYYDIDRTWYITGSEPGHVDPVKFFRATTIVNGNKFIEFITTYDDFTILQKWQNIENIIDHRIANIQKIISEYDNLPEDVRASSAQHIDYLKDLIEAHKAVLNQSDPDNIIWPPEVV